MPIYEYQCTSCHHQFECIEKMSAKPTTECPKCSKSSAQRLISAAGFQLKGMGWYATDFKDKPKSVSNSTTESEKPKSEEPVSTATQTNKE